MGLELTSTECQEEINSVGFIMVKPHAMRFGYDTLITDVIDRIDHYREVLNINISDQATEVIRCSSVLQTEYRYMSPEGALLRTLYHNHLKERGEVHLKTLSRFFTGDTFFLVLGSTYQSEELYTALSELKGKSTLLARGGNIVRHPSGLRGALIEPQLKLEGEPIKPETEHLLYNNIIHTSDNAFESALMCKMLASKTASRSRHRNIIDRFVELHAPFAIIPYEG